MVSTFALVAAISMCCRVLWREQSALGSFPSRIVRPAPVSDSIPRQYEREHGHER